MSNPDRRLGPIFSIEISESPSFLIKRYTCGLFAIISVGTLIQEVLSSNDHSALLQAIFFWFDIFNYVVQPGNQKL